ncbi:MAG: transposase, partial [SAR324 cluster bacterium]|nr:transposase [SAR324 cluster bacterium]
MKNSRADVHRKTFAIPKLRFEDQTLTSFSGLIVFQKLFTVLRLNVRLRRCFSHLGVSPIFGHARIVLLLVVHFLIGFRQLRDVQYYKDDPVVKRVLGLNNLPDVATISRTLANSDARSVESFQRLVREIVQERIASMGLARVTIDFDGSTLGTGRFAEGTAVGFNRKKKGQRSYYPLYCTIAQTGQVLDVLHRSGNVHDSNGAIDFIKQCVQAVQLALPGVLIEIRVDSAFFSDEIIQMMTHEKIEFTASVPF